MTGWLDPVRAALDGAPRPCPVFFRDDDAGWDDRALFALLDRFVARGLPVDVAVIPAEVTPGLVRGLKGRIRSSRVRVHQHGFAHLDHQSTGRRCEFGSSRGRAAQAADVAGGRDVLLDAFGTVLDPVFTPPWNRCTAVTGEVLTDHGIRVLSRDSSARPLGVRGLDEVPVTVDWFGRSRGVPWTRDELGARIAACVRGGGPVGVMLHHAVTDDGERARVDGLLELLATHPAAAPTTLVDLAGGRS